MPRIDPATGERIDESGIDPSTGERLRSFGQRMADAAVDVPAGMIKGAARIGQMIPGMSRATDALYGLPPGASGQATQPTNDSQKAGGYLTDLALLAATGGAEAGPAIMGRAGFISNPTIAERGLVGAQDAAGFAGDVVSALKAQLSSGPVTPEKVAKLIATYGKHAVKAAILGAGLGSGYAALKHLF